MTIEIIAVLVDELLMLISVVVDLNIVRLTLVTCRELRRRKLGWLKRRLR